MPMRMLRNWYHTTIADVRVWVTGTIVFGFFGAYVLSWIRGDREELNTLDGSMIAAFAGAWGYWLGSAAHSVPGWKEPKEKEKKDAVDSPRVSKPPREGS